MLSDETFRENLIRQIKRHDGRVTDAFSKHIRYLDSRCIPTIGYGHNLQTGPLPAHDVLGGLTEDEACSILYGDLHLVEIGLEEHLTWAMDDGVICDARRGVIYDMAFNLGIKGLLKFRKFLAAAESGDIITAVDQMLDSTWARKAPYRAITLARIWMRGEWLT